MRVFNAFCKTELMRAEIMVVSVVHVLKIASLAWNPEAPRRVQKTRHWSRYLALHIQFVSYIRQNLSLP